MPNRNVTVVKNDWEKVRRAVRAAVAQSVIEITEDLKNQSVQLAPVLIGALRASARTEYSKDGMTGIVSFNTFYAATQHEHTSYAHPQGGQAKFLETPLVRNRAVYEQKMAAAIKSVLGS